MEVKVKLGLNGFLPLRWFCHSLIRTPILIKMSSIRHPLKPSPSDPIILYLRRAFPGIPDPEHTTPLALNANATIVRLGYRLSERHPYPTPVHDVLAGYDWVQKHLARTTEPSNGSYQNVTHSKVGICGELIGGSLASMLALSECHIGKPGISAAALGSPIVDWTSLFPERKGADTHIALPSEESLSPQLPGTQDIVSSKGRGGNLTNADSHGTISTEGLIALRSALFAKPETYFDPFTSPLLFFRTPGYDLPPEPSAYAGLRTNGSDDDPEAKDPCLPPTKRRRSHRKYPPGFSRLSLPKLRVEVGKENALRAQGLELAELARRSVGLWEEEGRNSMWDEDGTTKLGADVGKERVEVVEREGLGLWGERELAEIGQWFGEILRQR